MGNRFNAVLISHHVTSKPFVTCEMIEKYVGCPCIGVLPANPESYLNAEYARVPLLMNGYDSTDRTIYSQICDKLLNRQ
jgi:hypothetical protein